MVILVVCNGDKVFYFVFWKKEMLRSEITSISQDAIEVSFATAKRAHAIVLQEIEKGTCTWSDMDHIEKIRSRNTQRFASGTTVAKDSECSEKVFMCKLFNKGNCKSEKSEHVEKGIVYQHYCSFCYSVNGKKFDHPKYKCLRMKRDTKADESHQRV